MNQARLRRPQIKERANRARSKRFAKELVAGVARKLRQAKKQPVVEPEPQRLISATVCIGEECFVDVPIPYENPTKTIHSMNENGFWCAPSGGNGQPVFVPAGQVRFVVLG